MATRTFAFDPIPRVSLSSLQRILGVRVPTYRVVIIAWGPLLVLSILERRAIGTPTHFLDDAGVNVRLLFSLPLLLAFKAFFDARVEQVLHYAARAGLLGTIRERIPLELRSAQRSFESVVPTTVIALVAFGLSAMALADPVPHDLDSWKYSHGGRTWAGWYFALVSAPLSSIVILSWIWRLVVWSKILIRLGRRLTIAPNHADALGGLQPIVRITLLFLPMLIGLSAMICGAIWTAIHRGDGELLDYRATLIAFLIVAPILTCLPPVLLTPALAKAKRDNLLAYSAFESDFAHRYWAHLARPERRASGVADEAYSSDADLGTSFERLQRSGIFPVSGRMFGILVIGTGLPMVLLLATLLPADELLEILGHLRAVLLGR